MKGIVNVEFILSVFIFVVVISFSTLTIAGIFPVYQSSVSRDTSYSKAYQVSESVLHDITMNNDGRTLRADYQSICSNYDAFRKAYTESINNIIVQEGDSTICAPPVVSLAARRSEITRIAYFNNVPKELRFTVLLGR